MNLSESVGPANDAVLVRSSWTEPEQFGVLYDRHAGVIHRYLARRVGTAQADDLVSEAFRLRGRYELSRADARPWLFGIAVNLLRRHQRTSGPSAG